MKDYNNDEFFANCKNIDFSENSKNYEKNLETLKGKLTKIDKEENPNMKSRIFKRTIMIAAAIIATMSLTVAAFGETVWRYLETRVIQGEEYVKHFSIMESEEGTMGSIEIDMDSEGPIVVEIDGVQSVIRDLRTFDNLDEALEIFLIENPLFPSYLPEGFVFSRAVYEVCPIRNPEEFLAGRNLNVYYSDGQNELRLHIMYYEEEWGMPVWGTDLVEIEINGYSGYLGNSMLSLHIGDTVYIFDSPDLTHKQLAKIAESLQ